MKKVFLIIVLLFIVGCNNNENSELNEIINSNNYIIIDVRTKSEYLESHLVDAINIPYDQIDETITIDKNKTILVYCKSGKRSNVAEQKLISLGYDVYNLGAYTSIDLPKE